MSCLGRFRLFVLSLAVARFLSCTSDALSSRHTTTTKTTTRRASLERISFLALTGFSAILSPTNPSHAVEDNNNNNNNGDLSLAQPMGVAGESRPSAPLEFLLPAARVGVYIYQLVSVTEALIQLQQQTNRDGVTKQQQQQQQQPQDSIAQLDSLLLSPPNFIQKNDPSVSRSDPYGGLPIVGELGVAAQKQKERRDRAIQVGLAPQFFEVGELVGERRQWNQLQRLERNREAASEIRRALNIYTTNLNFNSNQYQWVGSSQEKRQRIRNDRLPTATDVIRSDLDARDLYRNQVQTSLEDAVAEFVYQQNQSHGNVQKFDATELMEILKLAQTSIDKWFGFIPDHDIKAALEAVQREQA